MAELDITTKTFDTFQVTSQNQDAYDLVRTYIDNYPDSAAGGTGFLILGDLGVGKTHLGLAFLNEMIQRYQILCEYANVKTALDIAKESFDMRGQNPLDRMKRVDMLFLDDMGSERSTEWTVDAISTLITFRYMKYLPTVYTSNALSWDRLVGMLSGPWGTMAAERIVDRLIERSEPVIIKGESRRKPLSLKRLSRFRQL
jgi:DNA replication protein DnaC